MGKDLASRTQCMRSRDAKVLSYLPSLLALMPTLHSMLALWCSSRSLLAACKVAKSVISMLRLKNNRITRGKPKIAYRQRVLQLTHHSMTLTEATSQLTVGHSSEGVGVVG